MKRLTAEHVKQIRMLAEAARDRAQQNLLKARYEPKGGVVDEKEVAFYQAALDRNENLLAALPVRGGVSMEDDISDEQRDEDEDEKD